MHYTHLFNQYPQYPPAGAPSAFMPPFFAGPYTTPGFSSYQGEFVPASVDKRTAPTPRVGESAIITVPSSSTPSPPVQDNSTFNHSTANPYSCPMTQIQSSVYRGRSKFEDDCPGISTYSIAVYNSQVESTWAVSDRPLPSALPLGYSIRAIPINEEAEILLTRGERVSIRDVNQCESDIATEQHTSPAPVESFFYAPGWKSINQQAFKATRNGPTSGMHWPRGGIVE
ncbi:hypothetical protein B0H14DRAFT_2620411 [Mycena olivaceomarginata]|nr:hypothetical protein B0H14DRAFT_2620411 [Mycena olivaceomarginata]